MVYRLREVQGAIGLNLSSRSNSAPAPRRRRTLVEHRGSPPAASRNGSAPVVRVASIEDMDVLRLPGFVASVVFSLHRETARLRIV
jgi:hypothetical protein